MQEKGNVGRAQKNYVKMIRRYVMDMIWLELLNIVMKVVLMLA